MLVLSILPDSFADFTVRIDDGAESVHLAFAPVPFVDGIIVKRKLPVAELLAVYKFSKVLA